MHERSLVHSLIGQIDEELQRRGLSRLQEVRLEIGEFAGIEPLLLAMAFEEIAAEHWSEPVKLHWSLVPLQAKCRNCATEFAVSQFQFVCPKCEARTVDVISGEDLKLVSLRIETEPLSQGASA